MSQGASCKCPEKAKPLAQREWAVTQRRCNHSAFSGYHETPSDYSAVRCLSCKAVWRTRAAFVSLLPDAVFVGGDYVKATHSNRVQYVLAQPSQ